MFAGIFTVNRRYKIYQEERLKERIIELFKLRETTKKINSRGLITVKICFAFFFHFCFLVFTFDSFINLHNIKNILHMRKTKYFR